MSIDPSKTVSWRRLSRYAYMATVVSLIFFGTMGIIHAKTGNGLPEHRYVGDETCEVCHSSLRMGDQFDRWKSSPHAKAFTDLSGDKALRIAKQLGIADPQESARCLSCHTTASDAPLPEITSSFRKSDGVQCESCHGPGQDYARFSVMISPSKSQTAGLVTIPDKQTCLNCHNPSSPTYRPFHYRKALGEIRHPIPDTYRRE